MQIRKLDIDTLSISGAGPDYGNVTVVVEGRTMSFRLDEGQTARLAALGAEIAAEIVAEIASSTAEAA